MRLSGLLKDFCSIPSDRDVEIHRLILDSRQAKPGDVFFAIKGAQQDGRQYIQDVVTKGVSAVLIDADQAGQAPDWSQPTLQIPIYQLRQKVAILAARFYKDPAKHLQIMGVTGTSGKTSCTHFFAQVLQQFSKPCGIIGTLGSGVYGDLGEAGLTTPDPITLQQCLRQFVEQKVSHVAMEVSSHSIEQGRINGIPFEIGIFTNLTQDHLDYHGDMQTYAAVKRRFLTDFPIKQLIINADDALGRQWMSELATQKPIYTYTLNRGIADKLQVPCIYAESISLTHGGIRADIHTPWGQGELTLSLMGQFNLSNALAVLTALMLSGFSLADSLKGLSQLKSVPGRMQALGGGKHPLVVVDYAHKPDALEKVLTTLRQHTQGKLICVFGCGGERDQGKRPLMAKIAERLADQVIITNDNPRHENPEAIASDIFSGFSHPDKALLELDRSKAIENSIQWATKEDCVLIAGKGAERYQQIGDEKLPFDDVLKVASCLARDI